MRKTNSLRLMSWAVVLLSVPGLTFAFEPDQNRAQKIARKISASDWQAIRAAHGASLHALTSIDGGFTARNPGQGWQIDFDPSGFVARPASGGWEWGLKLESYGSAGRLTAIARNTAVRAEGSRITYRREDGLWEWMNNEASGLEHGFTVAQSAAEPNELEFRFAVRGSLRPELSRDRQTVHFVDEHKAPIINYSGLAAWDAEGRELASHFAVESGKVSMKVQTAGARYPITIDPLAQQAYLKASNTGSEDSFGFVVAASGDTVVVGAPLEDSNATGVNGNQTNNGALDAGAAYIFVRNGSTWTQQAYLKASNTDAGDNFGTSVAISGDTAVVGAPFEASNATGINGNQTDNSAADAGAAYVFVRNGTSWTQQAYLKASNAEGKDNFAQAVAISDGSIIVGAFGEASNATGVNGDQTNNGAFNSGAAYVFTRTGTTWSQQAYLKASNTGANDIFGASVAISDDLAVVGAYSEDSDASGVNGDGANNNAPSSGAAYVFNRSGTAWSQQAYLKASNTDPSDLFGFTVAVSGETVVVSAPFEDSKATGVDGDESDNSVIDAGAAYVYVRNSSIWSQQAYLKASNTETNDFFGGGVAISGNTLMVSAPLEDSSATGVNGDETLNDAIDAGAAYVFTRTGTIWKQQAYLKASNTEAGDNFGGAVAISGETMVLGALFEDSNATGINGNEANNGSLDAGAAYVFSLTTTLANISTRLRVETGDNVLIGGFIINGSATKDVLVRAIGPSLPLPGKLTNPTLELYDIAGTLLASNDDWMDASDSQEISATGLAPTDKLESAILANLEPGAYTAIVRGANNGSGIGLVEAYDMAAAGASQLANISTRGFVQTGDDVMIGGFILLGTAAEDVLVRALGPSIPLPSTLADPTLELFDGNGALLASNNNWRDTQETAISATMLAPVNDAESAILATLNPGAYTAIVRGVDGTTGIGLVEVYALGP